MAYKVIMPPCN